MRNRFKAVLIAALAVTTLMSGAVSAGAGSAGSLSLAASPAGTAPAPWTASSAASPKTAVPLSATAFKQIAAGMYYSVALRADGTVWTWGRNLWGELGVTTDNPITSVAAPVRLPNLSGITAIATNGDGMQVGLKSDGTVWEWGSITGLKANIRETVPPRQVEGLAGATAAVALKSAGAALKADGGLRVWTHDAATGKANVKQVSGTFEWTNLVACGDMAFALDAAGTAWGFGSRLEADGSMTIVNPYRLTGVPVLKQLAGCTSGIDRSGGAWTWTLSPNGVYEGQDLAPVKVTGKAKRVHPELKAKAIVPGGLLLTESGDVWRLDNGPTGKAGKVKGLSNIVSIAVGPFHNLALDAVGRVWGWGADNWNETGIVRPDGDGMVYAPKPIQTAMNAYVNGKLLDSPFPARIDNGSASVPMKAVLQALGGSFTVNNDYSTTITYKQSTAVLLPDGGFAEIGGKRVALPAVKLGFSGVRMIPVSLLKLLGVHAAWDGKLGELRLSGA
ncbi:hypothetical protein GXP70_03680 [Paenibacillus lycopersici]|uniref:Copper amine oxidase-like N-terminal domain-containing protein n=1 Tax=Paenibacillus lycopersici TaxID=2704462 RepID=A0A6C0FUL3_9BACL|nr:stalk domain-containing protein [Paenibacillus lycopersici]QHT59151.1 hypothetical protein GXP70_03680 [Paenibacillus lycopersici]